MRKQTTTKQLLDKKIITNLLIYCDMNYKDVSQYLDFSKMRLSVLMNKQLKERV